MKNTLLFLLVLLSLGGCRTQQERIIEEKAFILKFEGLDVYRCENGFLVHRYLRCNDDPCVSVLILVKNNNYDPVRCQDEK